MPFLSSLSNQDYSRFREARSIWMPIYKRTPRFICTRFSFPAHVRVQPDGPFHTFISLINSVSDNSTLIGELARLVGGILVCRRREFVALRPWSPLIHTNDPFSVPFLCGRLFCSSFFVHLHDCFKYYCDVASTIQIQATQNTETRYSNFWPWQ